METINVNGKEYVLKSDIKEQKKDKKDKGIDLEGGITDSTHCMSIVKLPIDCDEKTIVGKYVLKKRKGIKIYEDLNIENDDKTLKVYLDGKKLTSLSKDFFERAIKVLSSWNDYRQFEVLTGTDEEAPIIIYSNRFGIAIAPRVEA